MPTVNVDVGEGSFSHKALEPAPKGIYLMSLRDLPLQIVKAASSGNKMVVANLTIEADAEGNETPEKGKPVFNNIVLSKGDRWNGFDQLVHLALCFGVLTAEQVKAANGQRLPVDTDNFTSDMRGKVQLGVQAARTDPDTGEDYPARNTVRRFLWPGCDEKEESSD